MMVHETASPRGKAPALDGGAAAAQAWIARIDPPLARRRARPARRAALRRQGQHRRRRCAHHRRLPGLRAHAGRPCPCGAAAARCRCKPASARPTSTSSPAASTARARPTAPCPTASMRAMCSGGSSSGSAYAVATGEVDFALGTDTAGSGRVPAGLNNIVGLKPSRGLISARGVVPAAQSVDCVSIFAPTVGLAARVLQAAMGFDAEDPYARRLALATRPLPARFRFGVPRAPRFFGDALSAAAFERSPRADAGPGRHARRHRLRAARRGRRAALRQRAGGRALCRRAQLLRCATRRRSSSRCAASWPRAGATARPTSSMPARSCSALGQRAAAMWERHRPAAGAHRARALHHRGDARRRRSRSTATSANTPTSSTSSTTRRSRCLPACARTGCPSASR